MARFVCRYRDGSRKDIPDLEELGRRIRNGEIDAETELYDSSTDRWSRAGELAIFHFLQEEEDPQTGVPGPAAPSTEAAMPPQDAATPSENAAPPPEDGVAPEVEPVGGSPSSEPSGSPDLPPLEPSPDPDAEAASPNEPAAPSVDEPSLDPEADPPEEEAAPPSPDLEELALEGPDLAAEGGEILAGRESFVDPADFGRAESEEPEVEGGGTPDTPGSTLEPLEPGTPSPAGAPTEVSGPADPEAPGDGEAFPWMEEPQPPREVRERRERRRSRRVARNHRSRVPRWLLAAGVAGAAVGSATFLVASSEPEGMTQEEGEPQLAVAPEPSSGVDEGDPNVLPEAGGLPDHLREAEEELRTAVAGRLADRVGEMREAHGLGDAPPDGWLTGRYFASAGEFEGIHAYWSRYGAFLDEMETRDRHLFEEALDEEIAGSDLPEADRDVLEAHLREAFEGAEGARGERYRELQDLTAAIVELHKLLEANTEDIEYTPAFGETLVGDPVLEAVPTRPELRVEINEHLDRTLEALDRSHGVEPVSTEDLMQAMFQRLWGG